MYKFNIQQKDCQYSDNQSSEDGSRAKSRNVLHITKCTKSEEVFVL